VASADIGQILILLYLVSEEPGGQRTVTRQGREACLATAVDLVDPAERGYTYSVPFA
jgi:hypothetical protein